MNNDQDQEYESSSKDTILNAFLMAGTVAGGVLMFFAQGAQSVVS